MFYFRIFFNGFNRLTKYVLSETMYFVVNLEFAITWMSSLNVLKCDGFRS